LQIKTKIVSSHTADSKPIKQEVNGTVMLPPLVFPGSRVLIQPLLALKEKGCIDTTKVYLQKLHLLWTNLTKGTLTKGRRLSTVAFLIKVAHFVKYVK
jgi:hypothetical protein